MIEVKELTKYYGEHLAVDHLTFSVKEGFPVHPADDRAGSVKVLHRQLDLFLFGRLILYLLVSGGGSPHFFRKGRGGAGLSGA